MSFIVKLRKNPIMKRILRFIPATPAQEKIDFQRASLLLKCHEVCKQSETGSPTPEDVEAFTADVGKLSFELQQLYVQKEITKQVINMFTALEKADEINEQSTLNESAQSISRKKEALILKELSYTVRRGDSSIPGAGTGVFINSKEEIPPGTVMLLYPGLVHIRDDLKNPGYLQSLLPDKDFMLMVRLDQSIIDGRTESKVQANPFALAHLVNHCGAHLKPNVIQVPFEFTTDFLSKSNEGFPHHLRRYIPNQYARSPGLLARFALGPFTLVPSVAFLSTSYISDGEELLMDYRLDPDSKTLPSWYEPYNAEEARIRWEGDRANTTAATNPHPSPTAPTQQ